MSTLRYFVFALLIVSVDCQQPQHDNAKNTVRSSAMTTSLPDKEPAKLAGNGALLLTNFKSFEELKSTVQLRFVEDMPGSASATGRTSQVWITNRCKAGEVTSILKPGISESDFNKARRGNFWDLLRVAIYSPFAVINNKDLVRVEMLGRRRYEMFGKGDIAFYDLAEAMVKNIQDDDIMSMPAEALSAKGYLNTFNHVLGQAFMTSIFSETIADYVADVHERYTMPELITGSFTNDQIANLEKGPVDNYIDMINNEWGQELGKVLCNKYTIRRKTKWTPDLLANYLNDIQNYHSWVFQIGFKPFRPTDEIIIHFAEKINTVFEDVSRLKKLYQ